jgi:hypothetical protein
MPPEHVFRYIPVHVSDADGIDRLAVTMLGPPPAGEAPMGAVVTRTSARGEPIPAAVVLPRVMDERAGPAPQAFGAFVAKQAMDLFALRKMADESALRVGIVANTDVGAPGKKTDSRFILLGVVFVLLVVIPGVRERLFSMLDSIPGLRRDRCRHCGQGMTRYKLVDFALDEEPEPLLELVRYDMLKEASRRDKARGMILERIRNKRPITDKAWFRFLGKWCSACVSGAIVAEVIHDGDPVDETEWEAVTEETERLFKIIQDPRREAELARRE